MNIFVALKSIQMTTTTFKTSDYLTTDEILRITRYFRKEGNIRMCLLIEFGVKTLLRYSDLNRIKWMDVLGKDTLVLNEKKTGKRREITIGKTLRERIETAYYELKTPYQEGLIFQYTLQHTNLLLKEGGKIEKIKNKNISTHSLRKSGARFIWENNGHSDEYLIKLSSILNHSSTSITRRYLGISREEIKDIYRSFDELM
jgi:site-specific recombinase XerD